MNVMKLVGYVFVSCLFLGLGGCMRDSSLIFYSKFDSEKDILSPQNGPAGRSGSASFVPGKDGDALYIPAHTNVAEFPFKDGFPEACTIDFWAKIETQSPYFQAGADPYLFVIAKEGEGVSAIVFEVNFNANNGCGQCGLFCGMTYGRALVVNRGTRFSDYFESDPKEWHHYVVRWNCAGLDGSPNIMQLSIDGTVVTSGMNDSKQIESFKASLHQPLRLIFSNQDAGHGKSAVSIDEVRIWATDVPRESI